MLGYVRHPTKGVGVLLQAPLHSIPDIVVRSTLYTRNMSDILPDSDRTMSSPQHLK